MEYNYVKALHIIFVVSWFSALFYIVRLFIYAREAQDKVPEARAVLTAQLLIMQRRLWYFIGWPAMLLSLVFGLWMLFLNPALLALPWMWLKLIAVALLLLYHLECQRLLRQQKQGIFKLSSFKLRLFNELATLFLVSIVFLVVLKSTSGFVWGTLGLFIFAALLMLAVFLIKKRNKNKETGSETVQENSTPGAPSNQTPRG
ncbi:MAG: CopD family protein [Bacteroidia bacterium]|jgi:putative membrane protein|nr:CopD family protein [Bacteroidia bacterium]